MAAIANSAWSLPDDPLRIEWVYTAHDCAAVGSKLVNIDIDRFVLVEDTDVVIDAHHSKDEVKGQREEWDQSQLPPGDANSWQDVSKELYFGKDVKKSDRVHPNF